MGLVWRTAWKQAVRAICRAAERRRARALLSRRMSATLYVRNEVLAELAQAPGGAAEAEAGTPKTAPRKKVATGVREQYAAKWEMLVARTAAAFRPEGLKAYLQRAMRQVCKAEALSGDKKRRRYKEFARRSLAQ